MAVEIIIPKLGLTMREARLVKWAVGVGELVLPEQTVLVLETDKVTYEMPSPGQGLLHPLVEADSVVQVSQRVGYLAADEAELKELAAQAPAPAPAAAEAASKAVRPVTAALPQPQPGGRLMASPLAKAMAREHGLDLSLLAGSGPGGRIIRADVLKVLEAGPSLAVDEMGLTPSEVIPLQGVRRLIAQNMHLSLTSQAQLTIHTEASAQELISLRRALNQRHEAEGIKISYNAIMVKIAAQALKTHPRLNAALDGEAIKVWREIHVGLAVDLGEGLIVPKIRVADEKSITQISRILDDLVNRALQRKLLPDEIQGGTFTLTNLGPWDVDHFTPIVNLPESAILGLGRIVDKPWAREGRVVVEPRMCLSLTFDHRLIDGAPAAAFLKTIKDMVEAPVLLID